MQLHRKADLRAVSTTCGFLRNAVFARLFEVLVIKAPTKGALWGHEDVLTFDQDTIRKVPKVFQAVREVRFSQAFDLMGPGYDTQYCPHFDIYYENLCRCNEPLDDHPVGMSHHPVDIEELSDLCATDVASGRGYEIDFVTLKLTNTVLEVLLSIPRGNLTKIWLAIPANIPIVEC